MSNNKLDDKYGSLTHNLIEGNVWLTEFEKGVENSWEPEHWGADGFTKYKEAKAFRKNSDNGVLMIAFTKVRKTAKVVGIYQLNKKNIIDFHHLISPSAIRSLSESEMMFWRHAFKAIRSWRPPSDVSFDIKKLFPKNYKELYSQDVEALKITETIPKKFISADWKEESVYCRDGTGVSRKLRQLSRDLKPDFRLGA